ncbi:uncharacterized membrane protein YsdA (DUF1294 family) [Desulfitobacterium sp. LBE]|uniref:DUF1294 domain-containing protein n=1 Tax=Desulfitobacterium sp. LBE TaxID=884086 RepID=UPI00119A9C25|nr:DUF1294 domain-containing protein [Desulfitobacterium sp. LBE]TWH56302.1 uncharacterized membrane protein YsdA (DUF1294 family) [Desulfitobacterium sp. LBE]
MTDLLNLWPLGMAYLIINAIGFLLMGWDKNRARSRGRRIPEKWFFILAFLGGALGAWLGMQIFRHKTRHTTFVLGIPLLLVWNVLVMYVLGQHLSL